MKRWLTKLAFLGILAVTTGTAGTAQADVPQYLVLRTPVANTPHRPTRGHYRGTARHVSSQTYAYGYFGAQPRRHWSRSFGYHRAYTQWSSR